MEYVKLPLEIRNKNIQNISVVINTLDNILFPNINEICKMDLSRFKLINSIQRELGSTIIEKESVYKYCESFEQNI